MKVKPDAFTKALVAAAFPNYRGRKFHVEVQKQPLDVRSYWDGGSRDFFAFVHLNTLKVVPVPEQSANDKTVAGAETVVLPDGVACVEHTVFQGKDCGVTVHVNPANAATNGVGQTCVAHANPDFTFKALAAAGAA
jgi:hypothetical protein